MACDWCSYVIIEHLEAFELRKDVFLSFLQRCKYATNNHGNVIRLILKTN